MLFLMFTPTLSFVSPLYLKFSYHWSFDVWMPRQDKRDAVPLRCRYIVARVYVAGSARLSRTWYLGAHSYKTLTLEKPYFHIYHVVCEFIFADAPQGSYYYVDCILISIKTIFEIRMLFWSKCFFMVHGRGKYFWYFAKLKIKLIFTYTSVIANLCNSHDLFVLFPNISIWLLTQLPNRQTKQ